MLFSSLTFLFAFLPIVLALYYVPLKFKSRESDITRKNLVLCLASLVFYAWGEPVYIVLMLISIVFNFNVGCDLADKKQKGKSASFILAYAIIFNLLVLGFFKYSGFIVDNINSIFSLNINYTSPALPIGISFYTFQALSYVIDVYRGNVRSQDKLLSFAVYITMFPQLIAGPIVQYSTIEKQLSCRRITLRSFGAGVLFFFRGLGKKVIFANTIGHAYSQIISGGMKEASVITAWLAVLCYTMQIYFDFSGYSDMAIGLGKMFGFDFPHNFNFPYISKSITEFWRRWHISLGSWFRDYVYIPLGGNRKGVFRNILNIAVVWTLTGLWHGASWNFVIWGAFYAVLLILEKFVFKNMQSKLPSFLQHIITMVFVMIGWAIFSSETLTDAGELIGAMFAGGTGFFDETARYSLASYGFPLFVMSLSAFGVFKYLDRPIGKRTRLTVQTAAYFAVFILSIIFLVSDTYNPFLYFRF